MVRGWEIFEVQRWKAIVSNCGWGEGFEEERCMLCCLYLGGCRSADLEQGSWAGGYKGGKAEGNSLWVGEAVEVVGRLWRCEGGRE